MVRKRELNGSTNKGLLETEKEMNTARDKTRMTCSPRTTSWLIVFLFLQTEVRQGQMVKLRHKTDGPRRAGETLQ